jgi:chitinase
VLKNKQVLKNILGVVKEGGEERKVVMMWKVAWLKQASTGGKTSQLGRVKGFLVW